METRCVLTNETSQDDVRGSTKEGVEAQLATVCLDLSSESRIPALDDGKLHTQRRTEVEEERGDVKEEERDKGKGKERKVALRGSGKSPPRLKGIDERLCNERERTRIKKKESERDGAAKRGSRGVRGFRNGQEQNGKKMDLEGVERWICFLFGFWTGAEWEPDFAFFF
ncbi:predicted protein [Uncinocarpus reesii 1704]|uniref:Uncharacterized protein n=1 Tax=Uncinocarpus reesii (strain UAMH 1704) TaxID=336963 RepID=C4JET1_UNCRE|nr:uncharacterized protein UREG_02241 [Uncinocarpus reesii 1704]EEP77392.1 predicted protein [Uncinocarpus reesii 1704]